MTCDDDLTEHTDGPRIPLCTIHRAINSQVPALILMKLSEKEMSKIHVGVIILVVIVKVMDSKEQIDSDQGSQGPEDDESCELQQTDKNNSRI